MSRNTLSTMWAICGKDTVGAREVEGYPRGSAYIVKKEFPDEVIERCRKKSWDVVFESDGMGAEPLTDYYVVTESGELKGHLYAGTVLWYADFMTGGEHENSYKSVKGERVRLGFSRW